MQKFKLTKNKFDVIKEFLARHDYSLEKNEENNYVLKSTKLRYYVALSIEQVTGFWVELPGRSIRAVNSIERYKTELDEALYVFSVITFILKFKEK